MINSILDKATEDEVAKILPHTMQEMARVVSLESVLKIVDLFGGVRLCVPVAGREGHHLAELIGLPEMNRLCSYYKGEEIEIPRCVNALRLARDKSIVASHEAGESNAMLARRFNLTERGVSKILSRMR